MTMKNTIATGILAITMIFGTTLANAGTLISDFHEQAPATCKDGTLISDFAGTLISDSPAFAGIVASFGTLISDAHEQAPCGTQLNGTLISD